MLELKNFFTPIQVEKLEKAGIQSLYQLITYLPFNLQAVKPLTSQDFYLDSGIEYLWTGELVEINFGKKTRSFLHLKFTGDRQFSAYLFSLNKWILASLKVGQNYQMLLTFRNSLFAINQIAVYQPEQLQARLVIGKSQTQDYFLPKYAKKGSLQTSYFRLLHRKLPENVYKLNFQGLIPQTDLIPQTLNLNEIHHPISLKSFLTTKKQWTALQFFLRLCLFKFLDSKKIQDLAPGTNLDKKFLKDIAERLPFQLSNSQKIAIWDILKDLSIQETR